MENAEQPINPVPHVNQDGTIQYDAYFGLTKREYFAAVAMQGLLANNHPNFWGNRHGQCAEGEIAKEAARHADELLKQLDNQEKQ